MTAITFTLDLEDHRPSHRYEKRYPHITREILLLLDQNSIKGTFFVVGTVAESEQELVREIAHAGHELAFHSYDHKQLKHENAEKFYFETKKGKELLEDIAEQEVIGYRAPVFSLTRESLWAIDILSELGFKYSSSTLPATNPLNGFPGAYEYPFYWPNGLLEIPVPVARLGPVSIPYLGGVYLRYLPVVVLKQLMKNNPGQHMWIYCHPYDFDPEEPLFRIKDANMLISFILWCNRRNTKDKIKFLLSLNGESDNEMTFSDQYAAGIFNNAPTFEV